MGTDDCDCVIIPISIRHVVNAPPHFIGIILFPIKNIRQTPLKKVLYILLSVGA
jgi:hypothetical protein